MENLTGIRIFPNPVTTLLNLQIMAIHPGQIEININNAAGKLITKMFYNINAGNNAIHIKTDKLPPGNYTLMIGGAGLKESFPFITQ